MEGWAGKEGKLFISQHPKFPIYLENYFWGPMCHKFSYSNGGYITGINCGTSLQDIISYGLVGRWQYKDKQIASKIRK